MINLKTFFRVHFDTFRISDANMQKFAEITLQRIGANNPGGIYTALLTQLTTDYNGYYGNLTDGVTRSAVKEGATIAMNDSMAAFKQNVAQKEGTIRGNWDIGTPIYEEFFPQGASEYSQATLAEIEPLMDRMVNASTAHVGVLGAPFVTLFTNLRTDFLAKRTAQLALIGEVDGIHHATSTTRDTLEISLMSAVLTVALNNIGDEDACDVYFDQSFISTSGTGEIDLEGDVASGTTVNIYEDTFDAAEEVTLRNVGAVPLTFFLALTANETAGTGVTVNANSEQVVTADQLGDAALNHFLNVRNDNAQDGSYEVTFE